MKIVVDDNIPYIRPWLGVLGDELARHGEGLMVVMCAGASIDRAAVCDADVLIVRTRTHCDASLLAGSSVRLVVTATIGYDHLDTAWLESAGIAWTNCPGCNATSVAQYVASCLLLLERERGMRLSRMTLGIVGVGHVGSAVVEAACRLGVNRIFLNDPPRQEREGLAGSVSSIVSWASLDEVLLQSDVVSLHTPLTRTGSHSTWHLIDSSKLHLLRPGAVLINAARGGVVDEQALLDALCRGDIGGAVIDTWEGEPDINRQLLQSAYIATPHIAGYSADGKANATRMSLVAVARFMGLDMTFDVRPPVQERSYGAEDEDEPALWLYDPRYDSSRLKSHPEDFEWQRGHYPLRRERRD